MIEPRRWGVPGRDQDSAMAAAAINSIAEAHQAPSAATNAAAMTHHQAIRVPTFMRPSVLVGEDGVRSASLQPTLSALWAVDGLTETY